MNASRYEKVGSFCVDAGLCWVGDPCYILHKKSHPKELGEDWHGFVNKLYEDGSSFRRTQTQEFPLGMVIQSGAGDGQYPVYVKREDGMIKSILIKFF